MFKAETGWTRISIGGLIHRRFLFTNREGLHMRRFSVQSAVFFSALLPILFACDGPFLEEESDVLFQGVAVSETGNATVPAVAAHRNGDWMGVLHEGGERVGAVFQSKNGDRFAVRIGSDGLPSLAYADGYLILFENYTSSTVDVAVISPNGDIQVTEGVQIPSAAVQAPFSLSDASFDSSSSFWQDLRWAAVALSTAGCVTAIVLSAGVALPCTAAVVSVIAATVPTDDPALTASAGGFAVAASAIGCGVGEPFSCATLVAELGSAIGTAMEDKEEEHAEIVAGLTGDLRFGGVWKRDDVEDFWFIIEQDYARDAWLQGTCYVFTYGRFIRVEEDVFTYEAHGEELDLRYTRISENQIRVTRLSDGFSATLTRTSLTPSDFTPECGAQVGVPPAARIVGPS